MQPLINLLKNARTSWKTSALGSAAGIALIYRGVDGHDWFCIVGGIAIGLFGLVSRDADKNSEEHGVDELTKKLGPMALVMLCFLPLSAHAFGNLNVETKPDTVHVDAGAIPVNGTVTATHNGEIHPGAFNGSLRIEKGAVQGSATASTTAPLISAPITTTPKTINVEAPITLNAPAIPPNAIHIEVIVPKEAIVIHAENTTQPIEKIKDAFVQAGTEAKTYLWYLAIAGAGGFVFMAIIAWCVHVHHMKERAKLEARQ